MFVGAFGTGATVITNTVTGSIISVNDIALLVLDDATIVNDGLIQSFGPDRLGILVTGEATITNSGNVIGDQTAIGLNGGGTVTNLVGGLIEGGQGVIGSTPTDIVINYGTITGNRDFGSGLTAVNLFDGDDTFQQWQTGVTNGVVDGGTGDDTLIFGNDDSSLLTRSLNDISDPTQYVNFETIAFLDMGGGINLTGASDFALTLLGGDLILDGTLGNSLTATGPGSLTVTENGSITTMGGGAVSAAVDGFVMVNDGDIATTGDGAVGVLLGDNATLTNNGSITTTGDALADAVVVGAGSTVINTGLIQSDGVDSFGIFSDGDDVEVTNSETGEIVTNGTGGFAISLGNGATVTNLGLIETNGDFAFGVDLGDIKQVIKLGVFVACTDTFIEHHLVANGASNLIGDILGEKGKHARAAVGVPSLPLDAMVEIEAIVEIND